MNQHGSRTIASQTRKRGVRAALRRAAIGLVAVGVLAQAGGCASMSRSQKGAAVGAAAGGALGYVLTGGPIGTIGGAVVGGAIGAHR
ncbi:hypothetical protein [Chitinasiproducens palmae]|uniref:Glycine zipper 2TM domain-containing protein n=1 Tax=Chitinasiproducens palmae TaxID=1770053 RepID=A0A1H2PUR7_9BURK|nr:hypothetical protein [Chitinasiproducens palmae]SDV50132.1 hypothetical protein SAMN05216551_110146 [Chitinasiproducens palmae]